MAERNCPLDAADMERVRVHATYDHMAVDLCTDCRGVFLDGGELGRILEVPEIAAGDEVDADRDRTVTCPDCSNDMTLRDVAGIEVDQCPKCAGIWLDRGELGSVQARARKLADQEEDLAEEARERRLYDALSALE